MLKDKTLCKQMTDIRFVSISEDRPGSNFLSITTLTWGIRMCLGFIDKQFDGVQGG